MNSQQLEYFCKVVEHGSLSRAALALSINQSALSRHMRNLEEELGLSLFYRNGRGVTLTSHGKRLLERASRALEEIELAKQEAANARASGLESVVIGMTPSVGRLLVRPLALELINTHPNMKLRFVEGFSGDLIEWLERGRLDMAVMYQASGVSAVRSEKLITERLSLVSSADSPPLPKETATEQLSSIPLILPSAPYGLRRLVNLAAINQHVRLQIKIEVDSFESMLNLVKAGLGSTILPESAIDPELKRGELQTSLLIKEPVTWTIGLATPTNRPLVQGLSGIAAAIRKELKRFDMSNDSRHHV
ncbi:LysR family transcriptional regulator [Rhizobium leguminosarum]|uniref:LysR family transcriptional regulator n=1 Tax=Rhizobium leguminosarum TaxID=384 RepID=UPI001C971C8E|nr:LysR family transcriptional regulator [Rhizobium leguminosarum]MBY5377279.1 LysR family transcriptional regulator [Rhizobium leguminosarum]